LLFDYLSSDWGRRCHWQFINQTALHFAAQSGSDVGVRMLVDRNADVTHATSVIAMPPIDIEFRIMVSIASGGAGWKDRAALRFD
jgi:hypothetical protein